jgi:hypothetical protein
MKPQTEPTTQSSKYLIGDKENELELKVYLNLDNLLDLPKDSCMTGLSPKGQMNQLIKDGFEGVQVTHGNELSHELALAHCGLNRISKTEDVGPVFSLHKARGDECITLHVGWGIESDQEIDRLLLAIFSAQIEYDLPAFIETHRSTITQDMWRTVQICERHPNILFNCDLSHYYTGQEMVYGGLKRKLDFMQPIFERTAFFHGRIASSGCIQASIESTSERPRYAVGEPNFLEDFKEMWTRSMSGFKRNAPKGSILIFAPELLSPEYDYARNVPNEKGGLQEVSDRYKEALLYMDIAKSCFAKA